MMNKIGLGLLLVMMVLSSCKGASPLIETNTMIPTITEEDVEPTKTLEPIKDVRKVITKTPTINEPQVIPTSTIQQSTEHNHAELSSVTGLEIQSWRKKVDWNLIENANIKWFRYNALIWSDIEPIEGERNWSKAEEVEMAIKSASEHGMETILIIRGTPEWAQADDL